MKAFEGSDAGWIQDAYPSRPVAGMARKPVGRFAQMQAFDHSHLIHVQFGHELAKR